MNCYISIIIFLLGFYYITNFSRESYGNLTKSECPNLLIQNGSEFLLYNKRAPEVPGINPIKFNNLEDYTEYITWQKTKGIRCPILYLQQSYNTQNEVVYKARPSPDNLQGGLSDYEVLQNNITDDHAILIDANRESQFYNKNNLPGFDPDNQYIGDDTPLDKIFNETHKGGISPNPMDTNWGGSTYTNKLIKSGYYKDNEVYKT